MTSFVVAGSVLHAAAAWALRATPSRPSVPVLSGLLLDARVDEMTSFLTISGYDFETRASVTVEAAVTEAGRMLLSGRLLVAVAKTVDRDVEVAFADADGAVQVGCDGAEWTLPALPVDDYPQLPELGAPAGRVQAGALRRALARVLPVISQDAPPAMTAVKVESDGDRLTLVGSDQYRLAVATLPWEPAAEEPFEALVPGTLLDTAARAAGEDRELVSVRGDEAGFGLATSTHLVTGRQMGEPFPPWRNYEAQPSEHHALVNVASLTVAVEQALVAAEKDRQVLLEFRGDGVRVSATGDNRRAHAEAAATLTGEPITVKVAAEYLRDAIGLHGSDKVTVHFGTSSIRPLLVLSDDESYRHTVMPVRFAEHEVATSRRAA